MIKIEMIIASVLKLFITSSAPSRIVTPIKMISTPGILWQKQPHFLVSQHFFSSVVSMMDFLSVGGFVLSGASGQI
jgi:hypothetical protein